MAHLLPLKVPRACVRVRRIGMQALHRHSMRCCVRVASRRRSGILHGKITDMGKKYDKPAIIGTTKIDPKGDSCQQGDEASAPEPTSTRKPSRRGHLRIVGK